ncbi:AsmA family protein [Rhodoferax antarcticus]|uniref:AsmA family protein n=1 Tax=Rhodoferax antarcticus TaxID=81479 RepID=UPI002225A3AD|nr:AsmA family protein [Rhodoferax antarcticus]MCW2311589.1 AsmA protein [Rhodoferax antarcticus]
MKALRIVSILVGLIVALLVVGAVVLYAVFDGEKIKSEFSRVVLEQTQRKLVIAGTPKLSVWPNVGIALQGATLSEHASDAPFASLDSARISVAVMPLLSRQVQVRALELDGLKATAIKNKDGSLNIADLLGQDTVKANSQAADGPQGDAQPLQIDVNSIRLANVQLTWRDDKAGTRTDVSNLSLSTGTVRANSASQTASVDKLLLTIDGKTDGQAFELKLDAPRLNLSPQQSSADVINLSATLNAAARKADVKLTLNGVQGNAGKLSINTLSVKMDAKTGDSSVKGEITSPVAVNLAKQSVALSKLTGNLDIANPAMPMKKVTLPIQGALQFNGKAQTATLDLSTQFDESKIVAIVNVGEFNPLTLAFDLNIDKLNFDQYLPPKKATEVASNGAGGAGGAATPDALLDLAALKGQTVVGAIRIGAAQVSNLKLDKIKARITLADGKLDVAPLSMNLYGGSANGSLSVSANGNVISVKQTLAGISINPLMKDLMDKDLLEGRGNVALNITTHGATVEAMKKALGGTASLSLRDGAIKGINLAQTLRDAKVKLGMADSTQAANASQKTDFTELAASFKVANGVARNDDLSMKSPYIRLGGAGDIDVGNDRMNYLAKATVVTSAIGQGGAGLGQLKGLTVPVRVSGAFESLSYKIEWGAMLEDATKAQVDAKKAELKARLDEKVDEARTKAEDALKDNGWDRLKGLFGR